jgi:hypothetical protein
MADLANEEGRCRHNTKIFITFVCLANYVININVQITIYPHFVSEKFVRKCLRYISPSWLEIPLVDGYRLSPDHSREELPGGGADYIDSLWSGTYKKENDVHQYV